ncbi:putative N-acetyltransferase YafP [Marinomonas aquimarina]|uniref:Putative N-acetyltransferase YafP n=1 Tax=Marinomonas aquimarina TaxID=295068 RepID=A0A1A8TB52_9GAMM|nr:GNAT family N-acetyltransferase [Marinomonas aquimarina]SBS29852.1 putative N-acetyltransferase YafP [Marinomonas aquimarina]
MKIRTLTPQDLDAASTVCLAAFHHSVAPMLCAEGIATFQSVAAPEAFRERMNKDTTMLVAEADGEVFGVAELREGHHLSMLFVRPDKQEQGIGRALLEELLNHAGSDTVTVKASLTSVSAYENYGFEITGEVGQSAGLTYQPMELVIL